MSQVVQPEKPSHTRSMDVILRVSDILEARGLNLEVRNRDYLLQFFYPEEES